MVVLKPCMQAFDLYKSYTYVNDHCTHGHYIYTLIILYYSNTDFQKIRERDEKKYIWKKSIEREYFILIQM